MATMKRLMTEHFPDAAPECQSYHQGQMNHHSGKAMEVSRLSRNHAIHGEEGVDDSVAGQHNELARAYGDAAKAHLSLADHHAAQFKKERTDTVKDMTKPIKNVYGKDGVK